MRSKIIKRKFNTIKKARIKAGLSIKEVSCNLDIPVYILKHYETHFEDIQLNDYILLKELLNL